MTGLTRERLEKMSEQELLAYHKKLKAEMRRLNEKKVNRHAKMKALGMNKKARANDPYIKELVELITETNAACQEYSEFRKDKAAEKAIQRETEELTLMRIEMDKAQLRFENKDVIDFRNEQADERRPGGPVVWFDPLFRDIKGAEKRLIVMMAREIGQARFAELKRIAFWDEHHKNNHYYSSTMFGGKE